jgi:hypothetical protein
MNSKEIYRTLIETLGDRRKVQGFKRLKGTFPAWTKPINGRPPEHPARSGQPRADGREGKYATIWFQSSRQGHEFTIELQYGDKPEPGAGKWNERKRFFALLEDAERREVARRFPAGPTTANDDYWFLAKDRHAVLAVAEWAKANVDTLITRIVAHASRRSPPGGA